jgi:hypothetical protein
MEEGVRHDEKSDVGIGGRGGGVCKAHKGELYEEEMVEGCMRGQKILVVASGE